MGDQMGGWLKELSLSCFSVKEEYPSEGDGYLFLGFSV